MGLMSRSRLYARARKRTFPHAGKEPNVSRIVNRAQAPAVENHRGHPDQSVHGRRKKLGAPDAPGDERWQGPSGPVEHTGEASRRAEESRRSGEPKRTPAVRRPRRQGDEGSFAPGEKWGEPTPTGERWKGPSGPVEPSSDPAPRLTPEQRRRNREQVQETRKRMRRMPKEPTGPAQRYPTRASSWFSIANEADIATVKIYNDIGGGDDTNGLTAQAFEAQLSNLSVKRIDLRLNSRGGDVFDGIAIYNALVNHPAKVHVTVDGVAASIASVIAMAGDRITMARGSQMMIHEGFTAMVGNADVMIKTANLLNKTSDNIAGFYAARAGGTVAQWRQRMRNETWYDAQEAVAAGLADDVAPGAGLRNRMDLTVFNFAGRAAAPAPDTKRAPAAPRVTAPQNSEVDLSGLLTAPSKVDSVLTPLLEAQ